MNRAWLNKKYWREGLSLSSIAQEAGVSVSKVHRSMKNLKIERRTLSEAANEKWKDSRNKERMSSFAKTRVGNKNPFYGKQHSAETKKKISQANRGKFRGVNGSNWQGGKTKLNYTIRDCGAYHEWRGDIFKRDDWICQLCQVKGGNLHVDHIKPLSFIVEESSIQSLEDALACKELWNIDNGRVLCVECHKKTNTYAGKVQQLKWS